MSPTKSALGDDHSEASRDAGYNRVDDVGSASNDWVNKFIQHLKYDGVS